MVGNAQTKYCAPFMPLIAFLIAAVFTASPSRVLSQARMMYSTLNGKRVALHQRGDFLLLLLHHGEQREPLLAGVIAGQAVVRFFLAIDLGARRKGSMLTVMV